MTKSELIERLEGRQRELSGQDVSRAVNALLEHMSATLAVGGRIEIRGFGAFALRRHPARVGRNPRNGESVAIPARHAPHFKPGKELRERVNTAWTAQAEGAPGGQPNEPASPPAHPMPAVHPESLGAEQ